MSHKPDSKINNHISLFCLTLISALFFVLSNPNFIITKGLSFVAWFIYVPYLFLIKKVSYKNCWFFSGLYGVLSISGYAYWLYNYDSLGLIAAIIYYFIFWMICGYLLKWINNLFKKNNWLVQWVALCSFEYVKTLGYLGFHYGITAYTQWTSTYYIQIVNIIGVFGLNCLIILSSAIVYAFISKIMDKNKIQRDLIEDNSRTNVRTHINYISENEKKLRNTSLFLPSFFAGVLILLFIVSNIYGFISVKKSPEYKTVKVVAIQHNDDPNENGISNIAAGVQSLIKLTNEALELNPDIDVVVWPETAVVSGITYYYNQAQDSDRKRIINYLLNYINSQNKYFVIGNGHITVNMDGSNKKRFNSSLLFKSGKNVIPPMPEIYSKNRLVPFSEEFPFGKQLPSVYKMLLEHGNIFWERGDEINIFKIEDLNIFTPICFEDTFPDICRTAYKKGARGFFSLANDAWSKSLACQYQHLAMAKMRAIENKVPVVISSVSGQTSILNENGNIISMANPFEKTYAIGYIPVIPENRKPTFYNIIGDVFGYGILILFIVLLISKKIIDIIFIK